MTITINASTSSGLVTTPDNSGAIALQNNGTTGLNIDASGRVTTPLQPAFNAVRNGSSGNLSVGTSSGSPTIVSWDTTTLNTGTCFSTATNRFTAPVAGTYLFMASISWYLASGNERWMSINMLKNGTPFGGGTNYMGMVNIPATNGYGASSYSSSVGQQIMTLNATDYVQIGAFCASGIAQVWSDGCFFSGFLIG
jgi:hypothetical protein